MTLVFARLAAGATLSLAAITAPISVSAQTHDAEAHSAQAADNAELAEIFAADQEERKSLLGDGPPDPAKIRERIVELRANDAERRARVEAMLLAGELETGRDYYNAAFIFQHGDTARDYLRAHTLAMASLAQGHSEASWIAAATLDRYLKASGEPQIYGTQFGQVDGKASQEPFDRDMLTDAERLAVGVPTLADQAKAYEEAMRAARR